MHPRGRNQRPDPKAHRHMLIYRTPTNNKGSLDKGVVVVLSAAAGGAAGAGRRPLRGSRSLIQSSRVPAHIKLHQDRPRTATNHVSTTFMRNKTSLGAPILRKETKEKKGDKPRNPSPEPEGARKSRWNTILFLRKEEKECRETRPGTLGNHDGTQCRNTRGTSLTTLPGTRWNQDMLMEQNARRLGRQSPEPNRNQNTGETMMEQNARIPGTKES